MTNRLWIIGALCYMAAGAIVMVSTDDAWVLLCVGVLLAGSLLALALAWYLSWQEERNQARIRAAHEAVRGQRGWMQ